MSKLEQRIRDVQDFGEEGGVVPVIDVAATSTFLNPEDMNKAFTGDIKGCYLYSRHSNPTVNMFAKKMAALEGMEAAIGVSSGMAAVSSVIFQALKAGDHLLASRTVYGGTFALFKNHLPSFGIEVTFVDFTDLSQVEKNIRPETKILFCETLSNPLLEMVDIAAVKKIASSSGAMVVVDNTFTPTLVHPGKLGADVVLHSCTKYISGASDLIAGCILGSRTFIETLIDLNTGHIMLSGPTMDPRVAHELYLRLDHLPMRMGAHSAAALFLAKKMYEKGLPVIYPGLDNHPHHALFKKQSGLEVGFGGMLTLDCGDARLALKLAQLLQDEKFGLYAVSLGFSRTLISCPALSTSSEIPEEEQKKMNLSPGLLRMSVGFVGDNEVMWSRFWDSYKKVF